MKTFEKCMNAVNVFGDVCVWIMSLVRFVIYFLVVTSL